MSDLLALLSMKLATLLDVVSVWVGEHELLLGLGLWGGIGVVLIVGNLFYLFDRKS